MLDKKAISLIVLIITIIVLAILAGTVILTLDGSGIIGKSKDATEEANYKTIQSLATLLWSEAYVSGARTQEELDMAVNNGLNNQNNVDINNYVINVTTQGVVVERKNPDNCVMSINELQKKYEFEYYSTLTGAVSDINNGSVGENADVTKEGATAGTFTFNGKNYVVLLKDTTETARIKPSTDMTINLGGNKLKSADGVAIDSYSGSIVLDGRIAGSTIESATAVQIRAGQFLIKGGSYISSTEGKTNTACINSAGDLTILGATINATGTTGTVTGINAMANTVVNISDSEIEATSIRGTARAVSFASGSNSITNNCKITAISKEERAYGITNSSGNVSVNNSEIYAYANYAFEDNSFSQLSQGIVSTGTLTLEDCTVMGTHCGVSSAGALYINGGTYEGFGHGGIYFMASETTSYVRNATIQECSMPNGYADLGAGGNGAGVYIGGSANANDISIYMDNCDINGTVKPIVLRGSSGEMRNTLYISNSTINLDSTIGIRIDSATHKLYIGAGCNFTASNTNLESVIEQTNDIYIRR